MRAQPKASHYINGRFVDDEQGQPLEVIYPATGEVIARLHAATGNIVELAVEAARAAQEQWAHMRPAERGRVLRRAAELLYRHNDEIARLETLDTGKPLQETTVADPASACLSRPSRRSSRRGADPVDACRLRNEVPGPCDDAG